MKKKLKVNKWNQLIKAFFLASIFFMAVFQVLALFSDRVNPLPKPALFIVSALAVIAGSITFWLHSEKIEADLEKKVKEKKSNQWLYGIGLILIVLIGFGLRFYSVGSFDFFLVPFFNNPPWVELLVQ